MASRKLVERVTARVFCHGTGGGNPVTVFASQGPLEAACQKRLAMDCEWESVMVSTHANNNNNEMAFFMPSGDEVSFCAHAALGGGFAVKGSSSSEDHEFRFTSQMTGESQVVQMLGEEEENNNKGLASLMMKAPFEESRVSHAPALHRLLREHLGVTSDQLRPNRVRPPPTFVNASVARPKTLVYVNSVENLHQAKPPKIIVQNQQQSRTSFAAACGAIDDSTGIYLYAFHNDDENKNSWECRQFPRNSGYPEDPATGIAAAALAVSLYETGIRLPLYKFYQGTAMGRPSLIEVANLTMSGWEASFGLGGQVEIDGRDQIEV